MVSYVGCRRVVKEIGVVTFIGPLAHGRNLKGNESRFVSNPLGQRSCRFGLRDCNADY